MFSILHSAQDIIDKPDEDLSTPVRSKSKGDLEPPGSFIKQNWMNLTSVAAVLSIAAKSAYAAFTTPVALSATTNISAYSLGWH